MPVAGKTETSQHLIDKAVENYLKETESVQAISKRLRVCRATVYTWIKKVKKAKLEIIKKSGMTPAAVEKADKRDLALENESLKAEVKKLRDKVLDLMLKCGEI